MMCIQKHSIRSQNLLLALALAVFHTATIVTEANIPTGANRQEHAALCAVIALASADLDIPDPTKMDDQSFQAIQNLNFSTADDEWKSSFYKGGDTTKVQEEATSYHKNFPGYEQSWPVWVAAATAVGAKDKPDETKQTKADTLNGQVRQIAHRKVRGLARQAQQLKDAAEQEAGIPGEFTSTAQLKALQTAILGTATADASTVTANQAFGGAPDNARPTACTVDGQASHAKTAPAQLACLCTKATGGGETAVADVCTKAAGGSTGWHTGTTAPGNDDIQAAVKSCLSGKGAKTTPEKLREVVAGVRKLVHRSGTTAYLGAHETGSCNGSQGTGICLSFSNYDTNPKESFDKLGWPPVLEALAGNLDKRISHNIKMTELNIKLQKTKEEAIVAIKEAEEEALQLQQQAQPQSKAGPTTVSEALDNKKKECSQRANDKKACTADANCIWKGGDSENKGECEVNTAKVTEQATQAGTGEKKDGAAGAGVNCSKHTKKEECEAENKNLKTGEKAVCGWIEDKCKDSSILVSKQFALSVVSAAFVALLF
uniref:Variant surface glycoprotein n=1 Tax=Trypanosoma brucei TaxID=5691 RepID=S5FV15_9TRYP|nr:variant surface glycoprotein [Trypanosoma brucei]